MGKPRFSIIMPVYNTGEILHTAIDSILQQSYGNFELLLIDDGSKDNSPQICDEYVAVDERVHCFHKKNGGICDARNYGIEHSQGEYIGFCDHDDEYLQGYLEAVDKAVKEYEADVIVVGKTIDDKVSGRTRNVIHGHSIKLYDRNTLCQYLLQLILNDALCPVWDRFIKRNIISENKIRFDKSFRHGGEDADFNYHIIPHVNKMFFLDKCYYKHYLRAELSTSAKLYDDIWIHFQKEMNSINELMLSLNSELSIYQTFYYSLCFVKALIMFLAYGIKLGKKYRDFYAYMNDFRDIYLLKDSKGNFPQIKIREMFNHKNHKWLLHIFIYDLFSKHQYFLIFLIVFCKSVLINRAVSYIKK